MNPSLSDGNESVIDLFILSANSPLSTQLEKELRDEGYFVTLFSDGTHLLETLRNGKPNLLMCDATLPDIDAFEVCRQIKLDDYLWNIPVLLITSASNLGDLLRVLDCNADNFIAHPFDSPYLISLIEGMLTVPVERQTAEQIKTQFKIKHEDEVFVVTADRRKLLEFLLSSFEIAVSKSADLSQAQENIQNLGITTRKLEENIHENTRVIGIINETLKTKEQKLGELTRLLSDRELTIREKIATLDQVSRDLSEEKAVHAEVQKALERAGQEMEELTAAHQADIDNLQRQLSDLASELAMVKPALERANAELASESSRRQETETELITTATQKKQAETALLGLSTEFEQLKINFGTEKTRAQEAEQGLNALLIAKTQSEQDLTGIINELKSAAKEQADALISFREESGSEITRLKEEQATEMARLEEERAEEITRLKEEQATEMARLKEEQATEITRLKEEQVTEMARLKEEQATEITRLKEERAEEITRLKEEQAKEIIRLNEELESEHTRFQNIEKNLITVSAAKEKSEAWFQEIIDAGKKDLFDLQAKYDDVRSLLEEKEQSIKTVTAEITTVSSARESVEQELASVSRVLAETNAALSGKKKDIVELEARLNTARSLVDEEERAIKSLTSEIATLKSSQKSSEQELTSLSRLLEEKNTALETAIQNNATLMDDLSRVSEEKQKAEAVAESFSSSLKEMQDQLEQEKSKYRVYEEQMSVLIQQRDQDLSNLRQVHEEVKSSVSLHETSLEQMKRDLDVAVSVRTELEGKLQHAEENIHQISQELQRESGERAEEKQQLTALTSELERLKSSLEQETIRRQESEDQLREASSQQQQLEQDLERVVSETKSLHADLTAERRMHEIAKKQTESLTEKVTALSQEKLQVEKAAADLKAEIEQARVALADESEDPIPGYQGLAADAGKTQESGLLPFQGGKKESESIKKRSLIVKSTNIPAETRPVQRAMVAIDLSKGSEPEGSQIKSVEDLFEDDNDGRQPSRRPQVSIIQESASEPVQDVLPDGIDDRAEERDSLFGDERSIITDSEMTFDMDETDDEDVISDDSDAAPVSGQNIAFNRLQWLDLLKWSHHCAALSPDQRVQIVRMGRLIQKGRKLTRKQEEQVLEMVALVQKLGYRIP